MPLIGNRPPVVIGTINYTVQEDIAPTGFAGTANAYDPDLMDFTWATDIPATLPPGITWDAQLRSFLLNTNVIEIQSLAAGQTATYSINFSVTDGFASTPNTVNITYVGANDLATVTGTTSGAVTEDSPLAATGTLAVTDIDTGEAAFRTGTLAGAYGSLVIDAAGNWSYALNNSLAAVQALGAGATLADSVTVLTVDGTATQIALTITGANEPVISGNAYANTLNGSAQGEHILGLGGNDTLNGNGGADTLDGGSGSDRLNGGQGADLLIGGTSADRFVFTGAADSASGSADRISDFAHGSDKIDLATIDAVSGGSNNAFRWIGANAFTAAGQLHYTAATGLLEADVNGDHIADLQIQLAAGTVLTSGDIIL